MIWSRLPRRKAVSSRGMAQRSHHHHQDPAADLEPGWESRLSEWERYERFSSTWL